MASPKFWIPYLRWDAFVADSPAEIGGDPDTNPDEKGINAGVTITASLTKGDIRAIHALTTPKMRLYALGDQEARLDDGLLKLTALQQEFGLLAKSPILELPDDVDLVYTFRPHHVTYNGKPQDLPSITVKAPELAEDVVSWPTIDLAGLEWLDPSTAFSGGYIIRQVPDDVTRVADTIVFTVSGLPIGHPVDISDFIVLPSDIDGGAP